MDNELLLQTGFAKISVILITTAAGNIPIDIESVAVRLIKSMLRTHSTICQYWRLTQNQQLQRDVLTEEYPYCRVSGCKKIHCVGYYPFLLLFCLKITIFKLKQLKVVNTSVDCISIYAQIIGETTVPPNLMIFLNILIDLEEVRR